MRKTILFVALFSLILGMISCGSGEEATVTKYFQAMKHNDKDTMGAMAVEPKDLEYKSFKIISVGEPMVTELELPTLQKQLADLKKQKKEQVNVAMEKNYDLEDLQDELDETRRRTKKTELQKKIEEAEVIAEEEKQKVLDLQLKINEMEKKIANEKSLVTSSTGVDKNFELYTGETQVSKVIVKVTLTNGEVKDYVFILRRNILKLQDTNRPPGRMLITKIATVEEFEKEQMQQKEEQKTETEEVTEEKPAADTEAGEDNG